MKSALVEIAGRRGGPATIRRMGYAVLLVLLGIETSVFIVRDQWNGLYLAILLGAIGFVLYTVSSNTFEKLISLAFFCLPFQAAFVIEMGLTVRLSHIFGALALAFGIYLGKIRRISSSPEFIYLAGFVVIAVASTIMTVSAPSVDYWKISGIRGLRIRSIIQSFQLFGMVAIMYMTVLFCRTQARFRQAAGLIAAGTTIVVAYGLYGFLASPLGIQYIDINNAQNSDYSYGYRVLSHGIGRFDIPRPRSTFVEPLNFANFMLFGLPLLAANLATARTPRGRVGRGALLAVGILVFLVTNSRGAAVGALVGGLAILASLRKSKFVASYFGWLAASFAFVLLIAYAVIPIVLPGMEFSTVVEYVRSRVEETQELKGRGGSSQFFLYLPLILEYPWLGVGFGNIQFYSGKLEGVTQMGVGGEVGLYWRLLAEVGILGTILYLLFLGTILWKVLKITRARRTGWEERIYAWAILFAMVADSVQRITLVGIVQDAHLWVMFGLGLALIQITRASRQLAMSATFSQGGVGSPARSS